MTGQSKPVNSDTFAFWKLPPLARSQVTKLMEQADVIHLSMHSKLFKRLLKAFKIGGVSIKFNFFCIPPEEDDFQFDYIETCYEETYDKVELWCPHSDHEQFPGNQHMLVHNNRMLVERNGKNFAVKGVLTFQEKLIAMEQITRHLLEIFHVEHFKLEYNHTKQNHIFGSFVWDIVAKFRSINVTVNNAPDEEDDFEEEKNENIYDLYELSHEQVRFLFNEVKTDVLGFLGYISDAEELTGIQLKHRRVDVGNTDSIYFVTMEHVIESKSEEVRIWFGDLKAVKVVELLNKWQSGEKLVNLKKLDLSYINNAEHQPLIEMLGKMEGVEKFSSQEAEEFKQRTYASTIEVGPYKIRKTTDGKLATFYVRNVEVRLLCD